MKQKKFSKGGSCNLRTIKNLKAEAAQLRRDRNTEKKKALLSSIQRDYFRSLVIYANESIIYPVITEEQHREAKQRYKDFEQRLLAEYAKEAKPLVLDLYKKYLGANYTLMAEYPYQSQSHRP